MEHPCRHLMASASRLLGGRGALGGSVGSVGFVLSVPWVPWVLSAALPLLLGAPCARAETTMTVSGPVVTVGDYMPAHPGLEKKWGYEVTNISTPGDNNPHFPALRSGSMALSRTSLQKQTSSQPAQPLSSFTNSSIRLSICRRFSAVSFGRVSLK